MDIVRRYVGHIHAAQVAQADALWYLEGPPGEELRLRQLSAARYRDSVGPKTYSFSYGGIDKGYHRVHFEPKEGDDRRSVIFYVRKVDGRWRLF